MTPSDPPRESTPGTSTTGAHPTGTSPTGSQTGKSGAETARDTARDIGREASQEASRLAERARDSVRDGVTEARDEASRQANRGIERTADEVSRTSQALETAAGEFEEGSLQHQLLHRAADGLSELSGTLRGQTVSQIAVDVAEFGRRNPAAFLGGAALVGFAIARFARASRPSAYDSYGDRPRGRYAGAGGSRSGAYGGTSGPGTMQQPASAHTPHGTSGAPTTPMAVPASTGTTPGTTPGVGTAGAGTTPGSSSAGSTGGGSAGSLGGASKGGSTGSGSPGGVRPSTSGGSAKQTGSDLSNKGKPDV